MLSICLTSTTTLAFIAVCFAFLGDNYLLIKIIFVLNYFVFITSYLYTVLINPGIPKRSHYIGYLKNKKLGDKNDWKKCSKCNILIPKNFKVIHCNICEACIIEHDHHCPWTGKCIGKYNLFSFYIFVNSLMCYIIMIFVTFYGYMFYKGFNKINYKHKK